MIRQCPCGFATDDQLWFESHQARHLLRGDRRGDVGEWTGAELERARRDLRVTVSLAHPGSPVRAVAQARLSAIDAELAVRAGGPDGLPGSPLSLSPWRGSARRVERLPRCR